MIARINESETLTKHTSCSYECKFNSRKWNNNKCRCECKSPKFSFWYFRILKRVVEKMVNM